MEKHEAELFAKVLDALLKIVDKQISPEEEAIKRIQLLEKLRPRETEIETE